MVMMSLCVFFDMLGVGLVVSMGGEVGFEIGNELIVFLIMEFVVDSSGELLIIVDMIVGFIDVCGDGIFQGIEECDDGNCDNGDGCDNDCIFNFDISIWDDMYFGDVLVCEFGYGIVVDFMGNVVVGGYEVDVVGDFDMWIVKYDTDGNQLWMVEFDFLVGLDDCIYGVVIDFMDNVLLVGDFDVVVLFFDIWVVKFDFEGGEIWMMIFDGLEVGDDGGCGVVSDVEGNVVVIGYYCVVNNDNDIFVVCFDLQGMI